MTWALCLALNTHGMLAMFYATVFTRLFVTYLGYHDLAS